MISRMPRRSEIQTSGHLSKNGGVTGAGMKRGAKIKSKLQMPRLWQVSTPLGDGA